MYYHKDGVFFQKNDNGGVRIIIKESAYSDAKTLKEIDIDSESWCNIIAVVSKSGGTSDKIDDAKSFHFDQN